LEQQAGDEIPVDLLVCDSMLREMSAGGVVIRKENGDWWVAAIELPVASGAVPDPAKPAVRSKPKAVLCLPKGLIDPGEKALDAALREVREETGIAATPIVKLGDIKYVYVRSWSDGDVYSKLSPSICCVTNPERSTILLKICGSRSGARGGCG